MNGQVEAFDMAVNSEGLANPVGQHSQAEVPPADPDMEKAVKTMEADVGLNSQKWQLWPRERILAHCAVPCIDLDSGDECEAMSQPVP